MENKWEYDYSGLYQNGYDPAPSAPGAPAGQTPGGPAGEPPRKKRGAGKRILAGVLALVLVAAVSFGGGYAAIWWPANTAARR